LVKCDKKITAICQNELQSSILSYGCENGMIKDFDIRTKNDVRSSNRHKGSRVICIVTKGKYLISASADGRIIIYDYVRHIELRELKTEGTSIKGPISAVMLMENMSVLVVGNESGLIPIDIQSTKQLELCQN
jgi:WD40 repeat protein